MDYTVATINAVTKKATATLPTAAMLLLRIELDDQLFLDRNLDLSALGQLVHEDAQG